IRGKWGEQGGWSAAVFSTVLDDDIQFVSAGEGAVNAGFYRNVGRTRRAGVELAMNGRRGSWDAALRYSWTRATFDAPFVERSPNNSPAAAAADIVIAPGNRIPASPAHSAKATLAYQAADRWSAGLGARAASRSYVRGDENNRDKNGTLPGYGVIDAHAR